MRFRIEGDRIALRKLEESDAPSICRNANDFDIAKYTTLPHPYSLEDAEGFVEFTQENYGGGGALELAIERDDEGLIGVVSLMNIDSDNRRAEIGYWLGKDFRRQGIMTEAVGLILAHGFRELDLARVYARVMHPNVASARLLEKSGFRYEGRMRKANLRFGRWMDDLRYGLLSDEFKIS